jgi:Tfp pilus assembly protein PilN
MPLDFPIAKDVRELLQFGTGVGIEIGAKNLEVVAARVRPGRVRVLGRLTISDYAGRTAGEWGSEYNHFLHSLGVGYLSATVLLPRREVIVRQVLLPGVSVGDMEGAIRLQLESLHPYGEDEVVWGWSPLRRGAALVGVVRRPVVDAYLQLFAEAGVQVSSFTFAAAAMHAGARLNGALPPAGFLALGRSSSGAVEVYGESEARPVFSGEFELAPERAAILALSELRLPPETAPIQLQEALPRPYAAPAEEDFSRDALPFATALAGACPRVAPAANVLPPEQRKFSSRMMFVPTLVLAAALLAVLGGAAAWSSASERSYLNTLRAQIAKLEPQKRRAETLDRDTLRAHARAQWLDQFRGRTRKDLDVLNELTRLIEPPAWTGAIDITRDTVRIQGEAPQATALWKILDGSRIFQSSKPDYIQPSGGGGENFTITATREGGK